MSAMAESKEQMTNQIAAMQGEMDKVGVVRGCKRVSVMCEYGSLCVSG